MTTAPHFHTVDQYIASFPADTQAILQKIRRLIQQAAPQATESITYGIPTFKIDGKYLVYFSGWQHHIALYPIPAGPPEFEQAIAPYISGKGTLKFPLSQPMPYELVPQIVKFHLLARG